VQLAGMDTISMGVTLAFAAECLDKGIVKEQDLGARVEFSSGGSIRGLIRKTAAGRDRTASCHGLRPPCKIFGGDSYKYLYAVKGMEIAGHSAVD